MQLIVVILETSSHVQYQHNIATLTVYRKAMPVKCC